MKNSKRFFPISQPSITHVEIDHVAKAISSGWVSSLGEYINLFESNFARFSDTKYAIAVSNGTTALHLALAVYRIGADDEVIIPDFTFIATANAVKYTGAKVVTVDIEKDTLCIDPGRIEEAITSKTKAIIPVHIYGHPANMDEINRIARKNNLLVIEDAAEAHGAKYKGKKVGSLGNCGVFSFYGNKLITTGEGGMITTNDEQFYKKACKLRDHAMSSEKRYWHDEIGFNYRMTNLQAALGLAQLSRISDFIRKKNKTYKVYYDFLSQIPNVRLNYQADWAENVYWMIFFENQSFTEIERDNFIIKLKENGVDTRPYFYPVSDMPMYEKADTPIAHSIYKKGILLPSFYDLQNEDVIQICEIIKDLSHNYIKK